MLPTVALQQDASRFALTTKTMFSSDFVREVLSVVNNFPMRLVRSDIVLDGLVAAPSRMAQNDHSVLIITHVQRKISDN